MLVAGQKTQALVLSQWSQDAVNCSIKVAGKAIVAGDQLKLLGVTLDRLLHFGPYCRNLRQRVRPRTAQLRRLTGRDWGPEERQLRTVASGYVCQGCPRARGGGLAAGCVPVSPGVSGEGAEGSRQGGDRRPTVHPTSANLACPNLN